MTDGAALPPLWHWLYFLPRFPQSEIGEDGHPKLGKFMPDTGLPRRMFAGAKIQFLSPLFLGRTAKRVTEITSVEEKSGQRSGRLVFVGVQNRISVDGQVAVIEDQTLVYRGAADPAAPPPDPAPIKELPRLDAKRVLTPDPAMLFRFSALTFNAHRIHYDRDYARNVEAYPDLVVHGPLTAMLLMDHFLATHDGAAVTAFEFRGLSPLFVARALTLGVSGGDETHEFSLTAFDDRGSVGQKATVTVA
jgi:3-methylfumaryl-CoA hydratase